ncbi:helix-turn-helix domain-containing protein [Chromobacterium subtsugae]|uniref:helix-turn-helix domain-containing protein n=1 Tax=Chromobacterium subtsugae TaxID=251747 RepID=UPI000AE8331F|nr:helix-turn-helix domain-containing protein [Chromobacterium subtsugae]
MTNDTMTLDDAATALNIGTETARQLADAGVLPGCKIGIGWVFLRDDVLTYLRDEVRRQTNARRAMADAARAEGQSRKAKAERVKTAASAAGVRSARRREHPNLDVVEQAA